MPKALKTGKVRKNSLKKTLSAKPRVKKDKPDCTVVYCDKDTATVKGSTGTLYKVTPVSCECQDFLFRKNQCKHIKLAFM